MNNEQLQELNELILFVENADVIPQHDILFMLTFIKIKLEKIKNLDQGKVRTR